MGVDRGRLVGNALYIGKDCGLWTGTYHSGLCELNASSLRTRSQSISPPLLRLFKTVGRKVSVGEGVDDVLDLGL
jgi:hypothetical protein